MLESFDIIRILIAFMAGYFLSLSGSLVQVCTKNNLAAPSTLGFDGVGVLIVIAISLLNISPLIVLGLLLLLVVIYVFKDAPSRKDIKRFSMNPTRLVLLGLSFNLFVGAIFSLIQFLLVALNMEFPSNIWFGSFKNIGISELYPFLIVFTFAISYVFYKKNQISILGLSDELALNLGINSKKLQKELLALSLIITVVTITYCGVFSFLGLLFPHIFRRTKWMKNSLKLEVLIGPLIAGAVLMFFDWLCYNFPMYGAELPAGMIFSILGAFTLIALLGSTNSVDS